MLKNVFLLLITSISSVSVFAQTSKQTQKLLKKNFSQIDTFSLTSCTRFEDGFETAESFNQFMDTNGLYADGEYYYELRNRATTTDTPFFGYQNMLLMKAKKRNVAAWLETMQVMGVHQPNVYQLYLFWICKRDSLLGRYGPYLRETFLIRKPTTFDPGYKHLTSKQWDSSYRWDDLFINCPKGDCYDSFFGYWIDDGNDRRHWYMFWEKKYQKASKYTPHFVVVLQ